MRSVRAVKEAEEHAATLADVLARLRAAACELELVAVAMENLGKAMQKEAGR